MDGGASVRTDGSRQAGVPPATREPATKRQRLGWGRDRFFGFDLIDLLVQFGNLSAWAGVFDDDAMGNQFLTVALCAVPVWAFFRLLRFGSGHEAARKRRYNPYALARVDHGSSTWAWHDDLVRARILQDHDETAMVLGWWSHGSSDVKGYCRYGGDGHRLVCGSTGSGKFTSVIAPLLLACAKSSAIVFDVKNGEAANVSGRARSSIGPTVALDPFEITSGLQRGGLNPLDLLRAHDPLLIERAHQLADALYLPSGGADSYWDDLSKGLLTALLIHVATAPDEFRRDLARVRSIIRQRLPNMVRASMTVNNAAGGYVRDQAAALLHAQESGADKIEFFAIDGLEKNTRFLDLPSIQSVTAKTTLDVAALRRQVATLYIAVPADKVGIVSRWLRTVYVVLMEGLRDAPTDVPLHVVMDEFRQFGRFERVAADLAVVRDLGVHFHLFVQSLAQLHALYGEGWQEFMGAATVKQLLGANDFFTAEHFSRLIGTTTVETAGSGTSQTHTGNWSRDSSSSSHSSSYVGRPLMTPDEILVMPRSQGSHPA